MRVAFLAVPCLVVACGSSGSNDAAPADSGFPSDAATDATSDGAPPIDAGGDASPSDSTTDGGIVNPTPTISSWLGTNVAADLAFVDVTRQLSPFDTPAAQKDANGYPIAGANGKSSTDIGFVLPTGSYKISFKGTGQLAVSGIGKLTGAWQSAGGEQRNTVQLTGTPGAFGNFLTLTITNGAGQTVTDVRILTPGFDYDAPETFIPELTRVLAPFRALRFMDWEATNNSTLADWKDAPRIAQFGESANGEPYEAIVELVDETGKDCWLTIPEHATDDFVHQFAKLVATNLDLARIQSARDAAGFKTPFKIMLEVANETWNQGFTAYKTFLAAANAAPASAGYDGKYAGTYGPSWMTSDSDLMKVGQYEGDRLVQVATIFRQELTAAGKGDLLAPVLSGWALGPGYSDVALQYIKAHHGDPKTLISYVAMAPYFGPDDAKTTDLATLFTATNANIDAMDPTFQDFAKLVAEDGLQIAAYEGGQSITGTANQPIKHLAQHDARMHDAYDRYLALWKKDFGASLFMHFSLAGTPGLPENIYQYGFWGSIIGVKEDPAVCAPNLPTLTGTESIASVVHHCPKYRALMEKVPE